MGHPKGPSQLTLVSWVPSLQSTCTEFLVWSQLAGLGHIPSHRACQSKKLPQGPLTILQMENQGPERGKSFQSHMESL